MPSSAPASAPSEPQRSGLREIDAKGQIARAAEAAQDGDAGHAPAHMRVDRPCHADRAEHQRRQRDEAEELLRVVERIAERLAAVFRRLEAPRGLHGGVSQPVGLSRLRQFQMEVMRGEAGLSEQTRAAADRLRRTNASGAKPAKRLPCGGGFVTTPRMGSSSAPSFTVSPTFA